MWKLIHFILQVFYSIENHVLFYHPNACASLPLGRDMVFGFPVTSRFTVSLWIEFHLAR